MNFNELISQFKMSDYNEIKWKCVSLYNVDVKHQVLVIFDHVEDAEEAKSFSRLGSLCQDSVLDRQMAWHEPGHLQDQF